MSEIGEPEVREATTAGISGWSISAGLIIIEVVPTPLLGV
jgi:hypothetical protein